MTSIKYLAQILAAILYTGLFTTIVNFLVVYPIAWYLSLPGSWMAIIFFVGGTILLSIISAMIALSAAPYTWICHNNIVAMVIAEACMFCDIAIYAVRLWYINYGGGGRPMLVCIIVTVVLIWVIAYTGSTIYTAYQKAEKMQNSLKSR